MNIILNGQSLRYPLTGIGWYTWHLLQGLYEHKLINQVICIPEFKYSKKVIKPKDFFIKSFLKDMLKTIPGSYNLTNHYCNKFFIKKTRHLVDENFIYHEPCYIFRPYAGPKICMIHDLSYIHYPEYHPRERVAFLKHYLPDAFANADHIITGSDFVRAEIINFFKIPDNRISRIYHGVSESYKPRNFSEVKFVLDKFKLTGKKYLLCVGTLEPRKNLERLIISYMKLLPKQRIQYPLVLVGMRGWNNSNLLRLIGPLIQVKHLYYLGYVSEADLPYLYSGAFGFIYLSIYEGFGLPLLEAMASGIPALAASGSSITEIVEDSVLLANPFSINDIYNQLYQLIYNTILRNKLKQKALIQASKFTWRKCIENTINIYRKVVEDIF